MSKAERIKQCLQLCHDGKCEQCIYRRWIREKCYKVLCYDALKVIEKLDAPEQLTMDI